MTAPHRDDDKVTVGAILHQANIIALPVASEEAARQLSQEAEEVVCLSQVPASGRWEITTATSRNSPTRKC